MKKLILLGFFFILASQVVLADDIFEDVGSGDEHADAINLLYQLEVIEGYENEDGAREYRPDQNVNRAEFLKILMGGEASDFETPSEPCFPDVKETEWYAPYVCTAKEEGWIQGYADGLFRPAQTINKVEALKVLGEAIEWELEAPVDDEQWYQPYLDIAEELNIITVEANDALMTRGDIAETIFRHLQVVTLSVDQYLESQNDELFTYYGFSYESDDSESSVSGSISDSVFTTVGNSVAVTVELFDEQSMPISGHSLEAIITTPETYKILDLEEQSEGSYVLDLSSYKAATYGVFVRDEDTGEIYDTMVTFEAGEAESLDVLDIVYPYENDDHAGSFDVVLWDEYGNVVEEDEDTLDFSSTGGELSTDFEDGVWSIALSSGEVGQATVSIDGSDFEDEVDFYFDSVMLGVPRGTQEGESFTVPVYVNMGEEGSLAEYDISIAYSAEIFEFNGVEDGDGADDFDAPSVSLTGSSIRLYQQTSTGGTTDQYVHTADLLFNGSTVGSGNIYAEDATLTTNNEFPVENLLLQQAGTPTVKAKGTKSICLDVFVLEGADDHDGTQVTEADITSEMITAELAYGVAAASCNCSHYIEFSMNYHALTRAQWQAVTRSTGSDVAPAAEDDVIEDPESDALAQAYGDLACIPVFYVPMLELSDAQAVNNWTAGWTMGGGENRSVVVDQSRSIGNTFAHELLHMLSRGFVSDFNPNATPEQNAEGVEQGASDPANIMNYGSKGFEMSAKQCEMIEWEDYLDL